MPGYDRALEIVAENPGLNTGEFREIVSDRVGDGDVAVDLLEEAVESEDIVKADSKFWIVRKGEYAFSEYDHEAP